jgi:hypothetical protein
MQEMYCAMVLYETNNFSEEAVLNILGNTYQDSGIVNAGLNYNFNPLDKVVFGSG